MTDMTVVPSKYAGTDADFLKAPGLHSGAAKLVTGSVVVPSGTAEDAFIGLVPFRKGATFAINHVHVTDIDAGTDSLLDLGIIYDNHTANTNDEDAFVSASTAGQAGGFLAVDEVEGLTLVTTGDGWLAVKNETNVTESEGTITFSVLVSYGD